MKLKLLALLSIFLLVSCSGQTSEEKFRFERAKSAEQKLDKEFKKAERSINEKEYKERISTTFPPYYLRGIPKGCSDTSIKNGQAYSTQMNDNRKLQKWLKREEKNKCRKLRGIAAKARLECNKR